MFKRFIYILAAASFIFGGVAARAQDAGALLDLLVRKKIISDQEAEEVRAELTKKYADDFGGQMETVDANHGAGTLWRRAIALRIPWWADGGWRLSAQRLARAQTRTLSFAHWAARRSGGRLVLWCSAGNESKYRSTNVTFGDDTSTVTPTTNGNTTTINGPFAKNSDGINVGQAYLGYRGFKDITLTGGKMPNPLVTTLMTWDADINPEGVAEQWKHTFTFNFGGGGVEQAQQTYAKDSKNLAITKTSEPWKLKVDLFANFAQFVYDDDNPENPVGAPRTSGGKLVPTTDAWLLAWQVGARFTFPNNLYAQLAPTLYNYTGNGDTFNGHFVGGDPALSNSDSLSTNQWGINSLLVFDMPMEIGWKIGELPVRIFGDFAVNIEGRRSRQGRWFPGQRRPALRLSNWGGHRAAQSQA